MKLTDSRSKEAGTAGARRLSLVAVLLCGCFVWIVPFAAATPTVVDQYTEHIPTPGGEQASGSITQPGQSESKPGSPKGSHSPGQNSQALESPGSSSPAGSPKSVGASRSDLETQTNSGQAGGTASQSTADDQGGTESALVAAGDLSGGMGIAFPLVLIGCLMLAVFAVAHNRDYIHFPKEKDVS